jgi:hypothetical protein
MLQLRRRERHAVPLRSITQGYREAVMNRLLPARRWIGLALLLAACAAPALRRLEAEPSAPATASAYVFVSPNTRDDLDVSEARRQLDSPEHVRYHRLAGDVLRRLGVRRPLVSDAVGEWQGSAENSLLVTIDEPVDPRTVACAAAWFGLAAKQKVVLAFHPDASGEQVLAVIEGPGRSLSSVRRLLDRHGFFDRTLIEGAGGWRAVVLAEGGRRRALERVPGAKVCRGRAVMIGAATADAARERYRAVLEAHQACDVPVARLGW